MELAVQTGGTDGLNRLTFLPSGRNFYFLNLPDAERISHLSSRFVRLSGTHPLIEKLVDVNRSHFGRFWCFLGCIVRSHDILPLSLSDCFSYSYFCTFFMISCRLSSGMSLRRRVNES